MSDCQLGEHKMCCCTCKHRVTDYHHCTTNWALREAKGGCVCSIQKGYICMAPELGQAFSGWTEHGLCEMHEDKPKAKPLRRSKS